MNFFSLFAVIRCVYCEFYFRIFIQFIQFVRFSLITLQTRNTGYKYKALIITNHVNIHTNSMCARNLHPHTQARAREHMNDTRNFLIVLVLSLTLLFVNSLYVCVFSRLDFNGDYNSQTRLIYMHLIQLHGAVQVRFVHCLFGN